MGIKLGNTTLSDVYLGSTPISSVYLGSTEIWTSIQDFLLKTPSASDALNQGFSNAGHFGYSLAVSEDYIVVGAPNQSDYNQTGNNDLYFGAVFVFDEHGTYLRTINNPNTYDDAEYDNFGFSVAVNGDNIVVGTPYDNNPTPNSEVRGQGVAYIFDATDGSLSYTLTNPNSGGVSTSDHFGTAVAVNSTYAIVGAPEDHDDSGTYAESGAVHVFNLSDGTLAGTIENPNNYDVETNDHFGEVLSVYGDKLAVGVTDEDVSGAANSGVVYIFTVSTRTLYRTITNPNDYNTEVQDFFGHSVSLYGDYVAIGVPAEDSATGSDTGVVYVYDITDGTQYRKLYAPTPAALDRFGYTVAIDGSVILASEVNYNSSTGGSYGSKIHIYSLSTGNLIDTIDAPTNEWYGRTIGINSTHFILGDYDNDDGGTYTNGIVKAYDRSQF